MIHTYAKIRPPKELPFRSSKVLKFSELIA